MADPRNAVVKKVLFGVNDADILPLLAEHVKEPFGKYVKKLIRLDLEGRISDEQDQLDLIESKVNQIYTMLKNGTTPPKQGGKIQIPEPKKDITEMQKKMIGSVGMQFVTK